MSWVLLAVAIVFELVGTTFMKLSQGFTKATPSILLFLSYGVAFTSLTFALKQIDLSVAYAIWSGVGTLLTAVIGFVVFNEAMSLSKAISILLIVAGVVGLNLSAGRVG
jgi:small multidrug resistance pump